MRECELLTCKRCGNTYALIEDVGGAKAKFNSTTMLCFDCIDELHLSTKEQLAFVKKIIKQVKLDEIPAQTYFNV